MTDTPTRFAVYLVPPAGSAFLDLGSAILGHDVRSGRAVARPEGLRPEWTAASGPYGFHLTVVEALRCAPESFEALERELQDVCACFSPDARLTLSGGRAEVWDGGGVVVLRYDANDTLKMLHALLTARLSPFSTGSVFEDQRAADPSKYRAPFQEARLRLFRTPRGLDTWEPHFTLLDPYTGDRPEDLAAEFETRFEGFGTLDFDGVALLRQDGDGPFRIVRDVAVGVPRMTVER